MSFNLLLILFSAYTSLLLDGLNSELKDHDLNMTETKLSYIKIETNQTKTIQLYNWKKENKKVYVSFVVLDDAIIKVKSNVNKILDGKNEFHDKPLLIKYNTSDYKGDNINITLTPNKNATIEIINIIQEELMQYQTISLSENSVNKNNFVLFLNDAKNKYKLSIKFKEDSKPNKCHDALLRLPTSDSNYILPASNYNNENNKCKDNYEFKIGDIKSKDINKNYPAFIFSIDEEKYYNYNVTITITQEDEAMNIFLYISIGLAGVFAVITFFLIRRKQSIDTKNDDNKEDLYNEENKDE